MALLHFSLVFMLTSFNLASAGPVDVTPDPALQAWVASESLSSKALLDTPLRKDIDIRAAELNAKNPSVRTDFLGHQLYISKGSLIMISRGPTAPRTLVDVTTLPKGASVTEFRISPDESKLAYGFTIYGTDWTTWKVISLADSSEVAGPIYLKSSGNSTLSWNPSSTGFCYEQSVTADEDQVAIRNPQIKFHRLGGAHSEDKVLFEDAERPHTMRYQCAPLGDDSWVIYRFLGAAEVPMAVYHVQTGALSSVRPLVKTGRDWGRFVGVSDRFVYLRTSAVGDDFGIVKVDSKTGRTSTVVASKKGESLLQAQLIGRHLVLQYSTTNLRNFIRITDLNGRVLKKFYPSEIGLADAGSFSQLTGSPASKNFAQFTYSTVAEAPVTLELQFPGLNIIKLAADPVPFNGQKITRRLETYLSHDGTTIPIEIFTRADAIKPAFVYLYIYGNIGIANTGSFNRKFQLMLELGGAVALAHVRGGGGFGLNWQKEGVYKKWNTIEDICHAAKYLRSSIPGSKIVLSGRSYGGMMTMTEYVHFQEDFDVYTPVVGVSDPLSFFTKEQGWWASDDMGLWRNSQGAIDFAPDRIALIEQWSPLGNLSKLKTTKPLMAFSQQNDTRVGSSQTIRFIKALQNHFGTNIPVHMIEYENGGHNTRNELVDEAAFIAREFGIKALQPLR